MVATQIRAGEHPSSYAGRAEIVFDAKYLPAERDELGRGSRIRKELETHLAGICQADPHLRLHPARIEWMLDADCTEIPAITRSSEPCRARPARLASPTG